MKPIIEIQNISKKYILGHNTKQNLYHNSFRDIFTNVFKSKQNTQDFWALDDVSFNIYPGESIALIGKNGSGKSTLLKVLSKITPPTKGSITLRGRIASLLEVGTGFHPELTGRENVYMNGSILGMRKAEINQAFDAIVDFSGVEKFLDTQLKNYSSGMQLRLAFAVAAHLQPEILVVDEVLAVGDAEFQKKCMGKMGEVSRSGRTIIFVSHNMAAVSTLCSRGVILSHGKLTMEDSIENVCDAYLAGDMAQGQYLDVENTSRKIANMKGVKSVWIEDEQGHPTATVKMGQPFSLCFSFDCEKELVDPLFAFNIETIHGQPILSIHNKISGDKPETAKKGVAKLTIQNPNLESGVYPVTLELNRNYLDRVDYLERVLLLQVIEEDVYGTGRLVTSSKSLIFLNAYVNVSN